MLAGKGKGQEDSWDIHPTVTYRHILGNIPSVYNPLRVICKFSQCSRLRLLVCCVTYLLRFRSAVR